MAKYSLLLCLVISVVILVESRTKTGSSSSDKWKCDASDEEAIDKMIAKAIVIGTKDSFPLEKKAMKVFCKDRYKVLTKVDSYKESCMSGTLKQAMSVFVFSVRNTLNSYCKNLNSRKTREFLSATPCLNQATNTAKECHDIAANHFAAIENAKESKAKLGQLCCSYVDFIKCIQERLPKWASCGEKAVQTAVGFVKASIDNTINLLCGEFNEHTDKCDNYPFVKNRKQLKYHSFAAPAIHIVASL